jgi:lipopolysaccharide biosynthesis regulator YciM
MLELLFLLLPIAAAYGWYMGRRSAFQDKQQEANRLSRGYVDGVDFLLSNQQDKAVDLFLDMVKEDSGTFEAHITLGNLFRSKGEVDRALRIHQSIMESTSISFEQRLLAIQQLGRDYMSAGLYDRAEGMFSQLLDEEDFRLDALQQLIVIYQSTSDWNKAIEVAERLVKLGQTEFRTEIAQFYCELALQAMSLDDLDKALSILKKAESIDESCVRVSIMLGRIWIAKGEDLNAIRCLEKVLQQDEEFISEALPLLSECYQRTGNIAEWVDFLKRCVDKNTSTVAELMLADILEQQEGLETAQIYINRQLQRHPTMKGFHRLMNYHLAEAEEGRAKESLILLRDMVSEEIRTKPRYRCHKCGFTSHSIYWHCPSCRSWATVKPIRGLGGH